MKVKIRKKIDELFALPPKPGEKAKKEEKLPKKVHAKANKWAKEKNMSRKQAYGKAAGMYRSGDLEESFPHGGQPYGGSRIQNAEKERRGHEERACHQGLRNIVSDEECAQMIEEELEAILSEKRKKKRKKRKKAGSESSKESSLRDWFGRKGAKGKKKGWVDCNAPDGKGGYKSCGRSKGEKRKKYPACRPTPGACKERGKGKSWGKKGSKRKKK